MHYKFIAFSATQRSKHSILPRPRPQDQDQPTQENAEPEVQDPQEQQG